MTDSELTRIHELQDEVHYLTDEINYSLDTEYRDAEEIEHLYVARDLAWVELDTLYNLADLTSSH